MAGFLEKEKSFRFHSYYDLKEALRQEGCPLCTLVQEDSERSLYFLFYENVNDVGIRTKLRASWGFCNWHIWLATQYHEHKLGIAIIYKDLLQAEVAQLEAYRLPWKTGRRRSGRLFNRKPLKVEKPKERCFTCGVIRFLEQIYMETLLDSLVEERFSEAYRGSEGICLPHLELARQLGRDHPNLPILMEHQTLKLKQLRTGQARKEPSDPLQSPESRYYNPWRSFQGSRPKTAADRFLYQLIENLVGKREVFGNDLSHKEEIVEG